MNRRGFTLLELLIALALAAVLGLVLAGLLSGAARAGADLATRAELAQEGALAHGLVAARTREAVHVYSPGSVLRLSASGFTSRKPSGGNVWTVGTDPILALVAPPKDPAVDCHPAHRSEGCFAFYAYYPVKRSGLVANAALGNHPGADSANDAFAWVLMEYRSYYASPPDLTASPVAFAATGVGLMLADFVAPGGVRFGWLQEEAGERGVRQVRIEFELARRVSGRLVRTKPLSTVVAPRNVRAAHAVHAGVLR